MGTDCSCACAVAPTLIFACPGAADAGGETVPGACFAARSIGG